MVPNFYLLGEPMGPQVQRCIGRSMKYNDLLNASFGHATVNHLPRLLTFIETGLQQVEACIAGIEQTWQIASDEAHALEDKSPPRPIRSQRLETETMSKETV